MIDRPVQKIISPFGPRVLNGVDQYHKGIDLRCYNFANWKKQSVVFPCDCEVLKIGYQVEWGWNVICRPIYNGKITVVKFIHLDNPMKYVKENQTYSARAQVGWTGLTEYMKLKKYKEHLHFETWDAAMPINPIRFYDEIGIVHE